MTCRICLEDDGILISACRCKGFDHGYTHEECLRKWVETSDRTRCEICNEKYTITERCGCSFSEYMYKFCTFQAESDVERHLLSVGTFLLSILYLIICFFYIWRYSNIFKMISIIGNTCHSIYAYFAIFFNKRISNVCIDRDTGGIIC